MKDMHGCVETTSEDEWLCTAAASGWSRGFYAAAVNTDVYLRKNVFDSATTTGT
jgi:hypothetical protein